MLILFLILCYLYNFMIIVIKPINKSANECYNNVTNDQLWYGKFTLNLLLYIYWLTLITYLKLSKSDL